MKKMLLWGMGLVLGLMPLLGVSAVTVPDWLRSKYDAHTIFPDLSANHRYYEAAVDLKRQGIVQGDSDTGYIRIDAPVNRAEAAKMLAISLEISVKTDYGMSYFTDVEMSDWFFLYVQNLVDMGVFKGYQDGSFGPGRSINLGEMVKIVAAGFGLVDPAQVEGKVAVWQQPYYDAMVAANLVPEELLGKSYEYTMKRGDVFEILRRTLRMSDADRSKHIERVYLDIDDINLSGVPAPMTLLSDSSVWLTDLTTEGLGHYYDATNDNYIIFGHSSIWPGDPSPYGPVFEPLLEANYGIGDEFSLTVDGVEQRYEIIEKVDVGPNDTGALVDPRVSVDAMLFYCQPQYWEGRTLLKATRIQ